MVRTQIYLTEREQSALRAIAGHTGRSQSDLIRTAIDRLIEQMGVADRSRVLGDAAGLWNETDGRPDFVALRAEADRLDPV